MLSGLYDLTSLKHGPFEEAYYGADRSRHAAASSLEGLTRTDIPCLFTLAEFDPAPFQQQAASLVEGFRAVQGHWPRLLYLQRHNHLSPVLQLGTAVDTLGSDLLRFIGRF